MWLTAAKVAKALSIKNSDGATITYKEDIVIMRISDVDLAAAASTIYSDLAVPVTERPKVGVI